MCPRQVLRVEIIKKVSSKFSHCLRAAMKQSWRRASSVTSKFCDPGWCWSVVAWNLGLIVLYFFFSIGLTFYQKWFIKEYAFPFPLSVVLCHLVVKFILATLVRSVMECYTRRERVTLQWAPYLRQLSCAGIASAIDIGLSNWSFEFITISLYTMTKSTCIIFILMFAVIFKLETLRLSLVLVVLLISTGLFMFTYHSAQFHLFGFVLVMTASITAGLRWTINQLVMQKKESGLHNPIDMMYHIQPWMILGILPLALPIEGARLVTSPMVFQFHSSTVMLNTLGLVLLGSLLAFLMELSEFLLLTNTSSLTLSITGIVKEIFTLYLGVYWNGDKMSLINTLGLVISIFGISLHVAIRSLRKNENHVIERNATNIEMPLLQQSGGSSVEEDDDEEDEVNFN